MTRSNGTSGQPYLVNEGPVPSASPAQISNSETDKPPQKWPLKTLIEILPIFVALTAIFSYSTIKNVTGVDLVTPLEEVLGGVPLWVAGLMSLVAVVGLLGMIWLIYIFSRAPIASDGSSEE